MPSIEISYLGLGPKAGYRIVVNGVGLRILAIDQHRKRPTSSYYAEYSRRIWRLLETLESIPSKGESGLYEDVPVRNREVLIAPTELELPDRASTLDTSFDMRREPPIFVKYQRKKDFVKYARQGCFKIGSLVHYRSIPDPRAQDPFEGFCNLHFRNRKNHVLLSTFGGENLYVFSGASIVNSEHMKQEFGSMQLILQDIDGFGNAVAKHLGAIAWSLGPVNYKRMKVVGIPPAHHFNLAPESIATWTRCPQTMYHLFEYLTVAGTSGLVFQKPARHSPEKEWRFVFVMPRDIEKPFWRSVDDPDLLGYFKVLSPSD